MKQVLILLILTLSVSAQAQTETKTKTFPDDFLGIYKGDLEITNVKGKQSIGMEFHLTATDSVGIYNYVLVYVIKGRPSPRNYTLKAINKEKGEYVVDENNGIFLDAKLIDNTLYNLFEVDENILMTTERFFEDYMEFEIIVSGKNSKKIMEGKEEIPTVISYPITVAQKAKLMKQ